MSTSSPPWHHQRVSSDYSNMKGSSSGGGGGKKHGGYGGGREEEEEEEGEVVEFDGSIKSEKTRGGADQQDATSEARRKRPPGVNVNGQQQQRPNADANANGNGNQQAPAPISYLPSVYGTPLEVETSGEFPAVASTLGPYFCLGQLGKGTFSSIHKCINMAYRSPSFSPNSPLDDAAAAAGPGKSDGESSGREQRRRKRAGNASANSSSSTTPRLAAAKVELTTFAQSGVLEGEATILDFLHRSLPPNTVPVYMGHYRSVVAAAPANASPPQGTAAGGGGGPPPDAAGTAATPAEAASAGAESSQAAAAANPAAAPPQSQQQQAQTQAQPTLAAAALVMEYLPGEDMHQLRERVMSGRASRRVALEDAVTLTADVMLPLLRRMHAVGIIHRDVKPSNCVLRASPGKGGEGGGSSGEDGAAAVVPDFCMVDFGLSKSILVPEDSPSADREHYWSGEDWLKPRGYGGRACYRRERQRAEFRGTSMYASPRVHQLRDYCPRDDMYSLLYVFCDLVSGGLPWMSYAATRDRAMCQTLKERVHGEGTPGGADETAQLLMGDEYHIAKYRRDQRQKQKQQQSGGQEAPPPPSAGELPEPLPMCHDPQRVGALRRAFDHLSKLNFWDMPDYDLIQQAIRSFNGNDQFKPPPVPRIGWTIRQALSERWRSNLLGANRHMPRGGIPDDSDPLEDDIFDELESTAPDGGDFDLSVLPVELRFRLAQMDYHSKRPEVVPPAIALRDWMKITLPLLYGEWDTPKYEGRHRTSSDGLKRDLYLHLLQKCDVWSRAFGNFRDRKYHDGGVNEEEDPVDPPPISGPSGDSRRTTVGSEPESKRRKTAELATAGNSRVIVSRAVYGLRRAIEDEKGKRSAAQGTQLSFTS